MKAGKAKFRGFSWGFDGEMGKMWGEVRWVWSVFSEFAAHACIH